MIDTIVLRIRNIKKYPQLYEQYYSPSKRNKTITQAFVDSDIVAASERTKTHAFVFHDSGKFLPITSRSTIGLPSSHYTLATSLKGDYLEFNFSIPKYLYGTNVMQFINMGDQSAHVCFLELKRFIDDFIRRHCIYQHPIKEDIEINRLDFCYNQLFNSKNDALQYVEHLKLVNKQLARGNSRNGGTDYRTSFTYVTRRYSFKCYHKGTEFKKNDLRKIASKNPAGLPLDHITEIADRTLRYEMTFRKSMLKYLVDHYFFVSETKALYPQYNNHVLSVFGKDLINNIGVRAYESFRNTEKDFTLKSYFDYTKDLNVLRSSPSITFDETIFTICYNTFWDKVKKYQVKKAFDIGSVVNRIDAYNSDIALKNELRRKPVSPKEKSRVLISALLAQKMNLDDLKTFIPKTSMWRIKQDLKKIGISTTDCDLNFSPPRIDYFDYKLYFLQLHNKF